MIARRHIANLPASTVIENWKKELEAFKRQMKKADGEAVLQHNYNSWQQGTTLNGFNSGKSLYWQCRSKAQGLK